MKSVIVDKVKSFKNIETEIPPLEEGKALIKVSYTGICGSDNLMYALEGTVGSVIGHEFSGIVEDPGTTGFKKGDIKAELKDGYLTIKAERKTDDEETDKKGRVIRSERFMGTCQRTFYVGDHVKKEDVAAAYEDGVLKLNVPKKVEQPKVEESHYIDIQ